MTPESNNLHSLDLGEITLSYSDITPHNEMREKLYERLLVLRRKDIRYRILIPGNQIEVCTGLFASVVREERGGGVYVRIQKEAIPWLLALGKGYSYIEKQVFDSCHSLYIRRAYLFLCSRMYRNIASFEATIEDWRQAMQCPITDTPSMIMRRYLIPLREIIMDPKLNSHYQCVFTPTLKKMTPGAGRKGVSHIKATFCLKPEYTNNNNFERILNIISKYYQAIPKGDLKPLPDLVDEIYNCQDATQQLFNEDQRYTNQYKGDTPHVANTVLLILKDRFGISARKKCK